MQQQSTPFEFYTLTEIRRRFGPDGIADHAETYGRRGNCNALLAGELSARSVQQTHTIRMRRRLTH